MERDVGFWNVKHQSSYCSFICFILKLVIEVLLGGYCYNMIDHSSIWILFVWLFEMLNYSF